MGSWHLELNAEHCRSDDHCLCWDLYIIPSITAHLDDESETSKPSDALFDPSSSVAECDVSLVYLEGHDSPHALLTCQSAAASPQTPPVNQPDHARQTTSYSPQTLYNASQSPSTLASNSHPATPQQSQPRYSCEQCSVAFNNISILADHYKDSHSQAPRDASKPYHCGQNHKPFARRVDFERHLRSSAHSLERYRCRCGKQFLRPDRLRAHVKSPKCSGGSRLYACLCGYSVESYAAWSGHVERCDKSRAPGRPKNG
ncbi:hypothetical protein F66182_7505 [Fusarium sp. NRRL 66182]|nr:hypothetical protein F66182_7505 [Fusarium sp. NRRL 66182]